MNELRVQARIDIDLGDAIDHDLEWFLDYLSEKMTGTVLVQDLAWDVKGATDTGTLILMVVGWINTTELDEEELKEIQEYIYEHHP